jgi:nucleotide-binding universal stress UspA family protein
MYEAVALRVEEASEEEARAELDAFRSAKPHLTMDYVLERGNPNEVILQVADEADCDVIVMGTHGRSGLSRLLMGSVTDYVMRRAPCPVVTLKEPMPEGESAPPGGLDSGVNV